MDTKMGSAEYQAQYALWDEFLALWPISRLRTMTLEEYTQSGSQDTFCYWLEIRLQQMGNIAGGSAFKFGIFSRKSKTEKEDGGGASYSENYAWYSKYGANEQEVFAKVRDLVVRVAEAAAQGDLQVIEDADLGQATKWKIAFHYQNRDKPCVIDVFMRRSFLAFLGMSGADHTMKSLQEAALKKKGAEEGILEFGARVWSTWEAKGFDIWKLSHGNDGSFAAGEREQLELERRVILHKETGANQANNFLKAAEDALFYLCFGNDVRLLGQFAGPAKVSAKGADWLERPYEVLRKAIIKRPYTDSKQKWTPAGNSTFWQVPMEQLSAFEKTLLQPYFGIGLEEIMDADIEKTTPPSLSTATGPLNRILYGPPGTGKTYRSVAEAVAIIEGKTVDALLPVGTYMETKKRFDEYRAGGQVEFVTFHPSYTYQDFVVGIRPSTEGTNVVYSVEPGPLKRLADAAEENWRASRLTAGEKLTEMQRFDRAFAQLLKDISNAPDGYVEITLHSDKKTQARVGKQAKGVILSKNENGIRYNVARKGLAALWPLRASINAPGDMEPRSNMSYFFAVLKHLVAIDSKFGVPEEKAPELLKNYVLIIDEINRGNIAKIFGELITLIEDDKRLGAVNELTCNLPYVDPDEEPAFGLPSNLYIVGTMNTADRSIALLDTALRRRFVFEELMPDFSVLPPAALDGVELPKLLETLNRRIAYLFDRDHTLGHAYFMGIKSFGDLEHCLLRKVIPLLQEYFFEDWSKIRLIFGDGQKKKDEQIVRAHEVDAAKLFGDGAEIGDGRPMFEVAPKLTPDMVKAIYE